MKLEQFVSETLKQIISGVSAAQAHAEQAGALINPINASATGDGQMIYDRTTGGLIEKVKFDVHVSVTNETSTSEGSSVGEVTIAPEFQSGEQNTSSNRIKFSVPVLLPTSGQVSDY